MNWIGLTEETQVEEIKELSKTQPVVIFKHSTRCSISLMAKNRLDRSDAPGGTLFYYLDLLKHRNISNLIASEFDEQHQSPQILLIKNGKCVYEESHNGISMEDIAEEAIAAQKQ